LGENVKLVIGIVRPDKANEVMEALYRAEIRGYSISRVQGHGGELERVETYRGTTVKMGLSEKLRFEIAVTEPFVHATARAPARWATGRSSCWISTRQCASAPASGPRGP
jgi:nitrogen regulatory protein PII